LWREDRVGVVVVVVVIGAVWMLSVIELASLSLSVSALLSALPWVFALVLATLSSSTP
jgi:hypothetical protein